MPTDTATVHLDTSTFSDKTGEGVVLVDFWATWCPPCRMLGPVVDALASEYQGRATVAKVNIDQSPKLASVFGVKSIPTIVFLRDGEEVQRFIGLRSHDQLASTLDALLDG